MSVNIPTHFVQQYKDSVYHLSQQKGSKLRQRVKTDILRGKSGYVDQLGSTEMIEVTSRHADTQRVDMPHARRRYSARDYKWSELIDDSDKLRMLLNPSSEYVEAAAMAAGRQIDRTIMAAADATAYTGEDGSTATAYNTAMTVGVTERWPGTTSANYGLNVAKMIEAMKLLGSNNVDVEDEKTLVINQRQVASLMKDSRHVSHDYNVLKPLYDGTVVRYHGFNIVVTELIQQDANGYDKCLYWAKGGMCLALSDDIKTRISERPDKNYSTQVFCALTVGATRLEEVRVGYIECHASNGPGA
jgi:ribosomal protein L18